MIIGYDQQCDNWQMISPASNMAIIIFVMNLLQQKSYIMLYGQDHNCNSSDKNVHNGKVLVKSKCTKNYFKFAGNGLLCASWQEIFTCLRCCKYWP